MAKSRIIKEIETLGNDFDRHWELIDVLCKAWRWPEYVRFNVSTRILSISTGGWSEHEKMIAALEKTHFWMVYWQSSKRGGHYEFDISEMKKPQ